MPGLKLFVGVRGRAAKHLLQRGALTKPNKMGPEGHYQSVRDIELRP